MTITVIGTGFVGVVSSAVFAFFGNKVYGLDIDEKKIQKLKKAEIPFYEPRLKEMVQQGVKKGNLIFTTSYKQAVEHADVIILAVGTPSAPNGQADLKYLFSSVKSFAPFLKEHAIVAIKSTVPPGTNKKVQEIISEKCFSPCYTASLPEFLKEGSAVEDTLHPDRIVIGAKESFVIKTLKKLHEPFHAPFVIMKSESAQMCKYAANAYLATRITFINQIANLCEVNGANIQEVIEGIGYDKRIGKHYWYPGLGYGGSCYPKDVKELAAYAKAIEQDGNLMVTIDQLNEDRIGYLLDEYERKVRGWKGKNIAVLGLSFKPNTNDMRKAPSTKIIPYLNKKQARVKTYDPFTMSTAQALFPNWDVEYCTSEFKALKDADVAFLLVEWPELISLDPNLIKENMKEHGIFIDTRNQYLEQKDLFKKLGITYIGVGVS